MILMKIDQTQIILKAPIEFRSSTPLAKRGTSPTASECPPGRCDGMRGALEGVRRGVPGVTSTPGECNKTLEKSK